MKTLFIIYTREEEAIGRLAMQSMPLELKNTWRARYNNNDSPLYIKRYNNDTEEYKMIKKKLFK